MFARVCGGAHTIPEYLGRHAVSPNTPGLVDCSDTGPCVMAAAAVHASTALFTAVFEPPPGRHRMGDRLGDFDNRSGVARDLKQYEGTGV
jgi:hypothetical protein